MKPISLQKLADLVGGQVIGDEQTLIVDALPLQDATAGCLTMVDSEKNLQRYLESQAAAVLVTEAWPQEGDSRPQLLVEDRHEAFTKIVATMRPRQPAAADGIHPNAVIHESVVLEPGVSIAPGVTIDAGVRIGRDCSINPGVHIMAGCKIGEACTLYSNCVLYPDTRVGDRVILHAGVVLGADGFGYRKHNGQHEKSGQLGWVSIEDDVELGAQSTVDRGTYGATRIGAGTKIDNQVQIGHNCHIGKRNLICAHVGIAGSACTGDDVVLAGQVGLADHVRLSNGVVVGAQAGVMRDATEGEVLLGSPATPRAEKLQEYVALLRLPQMKKQLKSLIRRVDSLQTQLNSGGESESKAA